MKYIKNLLLVIIITLIISLPLQNSFAGNVPITITETDTSVVLGQSLATLFYFFDLRDRETFIQYTFPEEGPNIRAHVQIFNVADNCNENNFFDTYTPNDTHVYNMRDIQTNNGNSSGVVLPDGAYGFVAISSLFFFANTIPLQVPSLGNFRIIDNNGYEYRTNAQRVFFALSGSEQAISDSVIYSFNFNRNNGVILSDVIGIVANLSNANQIDEDQFLEWDAQNVTQSFNSFDIDIINNNEVPFSCRDVIFACVDKTNPRLEELLEFAGSASVASFEYGINNTIPHSKNGELLCPGNTTQEGIVKLTPQALPFDPMVDGSSFPFYFGFVGLNNGDGRGSMDSIISILTLTSNSG